MISKRNGYAWTGKWPDCSGENSSRRTVSRWSGDVFQVKSNDGTTVEIRPYTNGNLNNPTLLKALDAAGIPAEPRMIDMVNSMMEEQMSIGRESLMDMARSISAYPDADIKSLVLMHKLDIPMSEEFIRQFEIINLIRRQSLHSLMMSWKASEIISERKSFRDRGIGTGKPNLSGVEAGWFFGYVCNCKEGVQKGSWSPVELQEGAILEGASEFAATEITGTELAETETIAGSIEETLDGVQYYARGSVGALFTEGQMKDFQIF